MPNVDGMLPTRNTSHAPASDRGTRGEQFLINGAPLYLEENPQVVSNSHEVLTARSVWDCSLMLAKYVEKHTAHFRGKTVLELGNASVCVYVHSC